MIRHLVRIKRQDRKAATFTKTKEALAELSKSVTPAKAGVQQLLKNRDSGFRWNDAQGLLSEA